MRWCIKIGILLAACQDQLDGAINESNSDHWTTDNATQSNNKVDEGLPWLWYLHWYRLDVVFEEDTRHHICWSIIRSCLTRISHCILVGNDNILLSIDICCWHLKTFHNQPKYPMGACAYLQWKGSIGKLQSLFPCILRMALSYWSLWTYENLILRCCCPGDWSHWDNIFQRRARLSGEWSSTLEKKVSVNVCCWGWGFVGLHEWSVWLWESSKAI